jgi:hypothetical protein
LLENDFFILGYDRPIHRKQGGSRIELGAIGEAKTYATMSTVCSAALLGGLVDLDVLDNQGASVETLGISVGLGVLQEVQKILGGLDGPAGLGDTELLAC